MRFSATVITFRRLGSVRRTSCVVIAYVVYKRMSHFRAYVRNRIRRSATVVAGSRFRAVSFTGRVVIAYVVGIFVRKRRTYVRNGILFFFLLLLLVLLSSSAAWSANFRKPFSHLSCSGEEAEAG